MSCEEIASSSLQAPVKQSPVQPTSREVVGGITKLLRTKIKTEQAGKINRLYERGVRYSRERLDFVFGMKTCCSFEVMLFAK